MEERQSEIEQWLCQTLLHSSGHHWTGKSFAVTFTVNLMAYAASTFIFYKHNSRSVRNVGWLASPNQFTLWFRKKSSFDSFHFISRNKEIRKKFPIPDHIKKVLVFCQHRHAYTHTRLNTLNNTLMHSQITCSQLYFSLELDFHEVYILYAKN